MADTRLKHVTLEIDTAIYFYDGELPVEKGIVTIPDGRAEWGGVAYLRGYRVDPDTGESLQPYQIKERVFST